MSTEIRQWLQARGLPTEPEHLVVNFTLSTVPLAHWFYLRNALRAEDLRLDGRICPAIGWVVELRRHDDLFLVQWHSGRPPDIRADQLRYRKRMRWPTLNALEDFPALPGQLSALLGQPFLRRCNVSGRILRADVLLASSGLKDWFAPCADTFHSAMNDLPALDAT